MQYITIKNQTLRDVAAQNYGACNQSIIDEIIFKRSLDLEKFIIVSLYKWNALAD